MKIPNGRNVSVWRVSVLRAYDVTGKHDAHVYK